ncbi:MAG: diguanylate cyclase, partial [Clostridia bacterium]|nr:diguanylate cyclase [Clostridia bacterium]
YVEDELIGVMGVDILISDILSLMDKRLNNPEAYAFILNEKRDAMVHSRNPERIGRNFMDVSNLEETAVVYGLSHGDFHTAVYEVEGVPVMAVLKKIESVDWVVGVALEREHIQKEALFFSKETTVINLLFFIVMLLIVKNLYTMEKAVFSANSILRDKVYELHAAYEQIDRVNGLLEEKSKKDGLTGVANRGYFDQEIEATWRKSIEEDAQLTLMLLDVDFFKMYNDKYGHVLGDQVLMDICSLIESLIDETDFFARVGGEEFAVLGYHKSIEDYVRLAEGIRRSIVDMGIPHEPNPHKVVTVSIGIHTTKPSPGDTIGDFYHKTDIAMYHSKETGRNKVAVFSEELMT